MAFKSLVESVAGGRPWPLFPHMAMMAFSSSSFGGVLKAGGGIPARYFKSLMDGYTASSLI